MARAVLHILPAAAQRDTVVTGGIKPLRGCPVTVVLYPTTMKLPNTGQLQGCMNIYKHECWCWVKPLLGILGKSCPQYAADLQAAVLQENSSRYNRSSSLHTLLPPYWFILCEKSNIKVTGCRIESSVIFLFYDRGFSAAAVIHMYSFGLMQRPLTSTRSFIYMNFTPGAWKGQLCNVGSTLNCLGDSDAKHCCRAKFQDMTVLTLLPSLPSPSSLFRTPLFFSK